jgi:uncharacterized Tic20 family protein
MQPVDSTPESRMWASLAHISALAGLVVSFGCVLGPLLVWMVKRDELPFAEDQAKEALNFNISTLIYGSALGIAVVLSIALSVVLIGIPLLILSILGTLVLLVGWLVLTIVAAVKANEGIAYRYPLTLRLVR